MKRIETRPGRMLDIIIRHTPVQADRDNTVKPSITIIKPSKMLALMALQKRSQEHPYALVGELYGQS